MPLSKPAPRRHSHTRKIDCTGYRREDGLWDIEGHLVDTKPHGYRDRDGKAVAPDSPIHDMWIRLTIDSNRLIHEAEAKTDASPYSICCAVNSDFSLLKGITIGPGWMKLVTQRIGGALGCTHLVELLRPVATTAYQTQFEERGDTIQPGRAPAMLNTCYALSAKNDVVRVRWPEFYTGPKTSD